jgi:transketolase
MDLIINISYKYKISHLSSNLTTYPIIDHIYKNKNKNDKVILSSGHAGLALYVALQKYEGHDAEKLYNDFGVHPYRDISRGIHASTGSLGCGITIATGMALADPNNDIYCIISDGECAEGTVWESLNFAYKNNLKNLKIYVNANGYSAYDTVDVNNLENRIKSFCPWTEIWYTKCPDIDFLKGLHGHYHVMNENNYNDILKII